MSRGGTIGGAYRRGAQFGCGVVGRTGKASAARSLVNLYKRYCFTLINALSSSYLLPPISGELFDRVRHCNRTRTPATSETEVIVRDIPRVLVMSSKGIPLSL